MTQTTDAKTGSPQKRATLTTKSRTANSKAVKQPPATTQWYNADLHLHTPASSDYQQPDVEYLDILKRAEARGLDIIAITDHNTIAGYRKMRDEYEQLLLLEGLKRLLPNEQIRLTEYRRLFEKILVLPGFEFTSTLGFHLLAIFPPDKSMRELEYLLLELKIPPDQLDEGSAIVGATTDALTVYHTVNQAGGLVIAAHANSSNGVAMRGFSFGGQTKIAYTQDPHLHALEVTDLDSQGKNATAKFFNGAKPEYPRQMHCIQGSDAHRLIGDPVRKKNLGLGERTTDLLLPEVNFEALKELFQSNDFTRTRPHRVTAEPVFDFIHAALEEGPNIIQDFHEAVSVRGGKRYAILSDVCAFANTNGGTLFLGINPDPKKPVLGVEGPDQFTQLLEKEINTRINPELTVSLDVHEVGGKKVVRVLVPRGEDAPYAVDDNKIYVRAEAETSLAVRDEIVGLVLRSRNPEARSASRLEPRPAGLVEKQQEREPEGAVKALLAPRTGVEVVSAEERNGGKYYTMRDLRNGDVVNNVTLKSARRLWHYAITAYAKLPSDLIREPIEWQGDYGLLLRQKQGDKSRYDLVLKDKQGYHYYFGVTEDGVHGPWKALLGLDDEA